MILSLINRMREAENPRSREFKKQNAEGMGWFYLLRAKDIPAPICYPLRGLRTMPSFFWRSAPCPVNVSTSSDIRS